MARPLSLPLPCHTADDLLSGSNPDLLKVCWGFLCCIWLFCLRGEIYLQWKCLFTPFICFVHMWGPFYSLDTFFVCFMRLETDSELFPLNQLNSEQTELHNFSWRIPLKKSLPNYPPSPLVSVLHFCLVSFIWLWTSRAHTFKPH